MSALDVGGRRVSASIAVRPTVCPSAVPCPGWAQSLDLLPQLQPPWLLSLSLFHPSLPGTPFFISLSSAHSIPLGSTCHMLSPPPVPVAGITCRSQHLPTEPISTASQHPDSLLELAHGRKPVHFARPPTWPVVANTPFLVPASPLNTHPPTPALWTF